LTTPSYETEERDLERLFAEARKYPLLSAEQEQDIDGAKWGAVAGLQTLFSQSAPARWFLQALAKHCVYHPPDVARFSDREHYFLLRRELAEFLPGNPGQDKMLELLSCLTDTGEAQQLDQLLIAMSLPASLVVGIAQLLTYKRDAKALGGVAEALQYWTSLWASDYRRFVAVQDPEFQLSARRLLKEYATARDQLILHNLRLVYTIAGRNRNRNHGISFLDLVQEGTVGLLRAAEKFESRKGFRFSTYCFNWISQSVRRAIGESGALIRYPGHVQEQLGKLYREQAERIARTGASPQDSELARVLGLSVEKTRSLLQLRNLGVSLDKPRFEGDEGDTLLESIAGDTFSQPLAEAEGSSLQRCLRKEIAHLDPAEQRVVISRWGLGTGRPLTRAEIADQMSVSREWVRQLEQSALAKLSQNPAVHSAFIEHKDPSRS